jgi:hypothetical protein
MARGMSAMEKVTVTAIECGTIAMEKVVVTAIECGTIAMKYCVQGVSRVRSDAYCDAGAYIALARSSSSWSLIDSHIQVSAFLACTCTAHGPNDLAKWGRMPNHTERHDKLRDGESVRIYPTQ